MLPPASPVAPAFPVTLALVEDDPRLGEMLSQYLCHQPEFSCSIICGSMEEFWRELDLALPPRVLLLDISLPGQTGLQALPELRRRLPETDVIVQTMHDDTERIYQALRAGATGYITKISTPLVQYKQAILDVLAGGAALSPSIARKVLGHFTPAPSQQPDLLSVREREVLQGLVDGLTEKQVAHRLGIGFPTVHTYVRRVYEKLCVTSRGELIARASRGEL